MRRVRLKGFMVLLCGAAIGIGATAAVGAANAKPLYQSALYGNIPNVVVRGVPSDVAPWVVKGTAKITANQLIVQGRGMVVPPGVMADGSAVPKSLIGTTEGIKQVAAELSCAQGTSVLTKLVSLSAKGDFSIHVAVKRPQPCTDPVILIGPVKNGKMVVWYAATNFLQYGLPGKSYGGWGAALSAAKKPATSKGSSSGKSTKSGSTWG